MKVFRYTCLGLLAAGLVGCGGGGGGGSGTVAGGGTGSAVAFSGTAAHGLPFTSVPVYLYSQDATAAIAQTTTDASGNYAFTAAQIGQHPGPYLVEVVDNQGGMDYFSSAQTTDLTSQGGSGVVDITPVTNWLVSNAIDRLATQIVGSPQFTSYFAKLTPTNLQNAALRIATQIQAVTSNLMGSNAAGTSVTSGANALNFLVHQSFTASTSSSGNLDAVLDALNISITSAGNVAVTNRLTNAAIADTLAQGTLTTTPPVLPAVPSATTNALTDIQQIENLLSTIAPLVGNGLPSSGQVPGIDMTHFMNAGRNAAQFFTNSGSGGVSTKLDIANLTLEPASTADASVLVNVPKGVLKTAILHFNIMYQGSVATPNNYVDRGAVNWVLYKTASGWQMLGDQMIGHERAHAFAFYYQTSTSATNQPTSGMCSGLEFDINDNAAKGITYAIVTGQGLPAAGLLYFQTGNGGTSLNLAAGAPNTYVGPTTPGASGSCSVYYNPAYFMSSAPSQDAAIISAFPSTLSYPQNYVVKMFTNTTYSASNTPAYTYTLLVGEAPMTVGALMASPGVYFATVSPSMLTTLIGAFGKTLAFNWTAPTSTTEIANYLNFYASAPNNSNAVSASIDNPYPLDSSDLLTLPTLPQGVTFGNNYGGNVELNYRDELGGRFDTQYQF